MWVIPQLVGHANFQVKFLIPSSDALFSPERYLELTQTVQGFPQCLEMAN